MKDINVGDYVRTKNNKIYKIIDKKIDETILVDLYQTDISGYLMEIDIKKSSPQIIDLIGVGDIIRGKDNHLFEVYAVGSDCVYINNLEEFILIKDIKGIVTKEQFSQMEYKIEE